MELKIKAKIGTAKAGGVKAYRACPGDLHKAVNAAAHYAAKNGARMVVIGGNSFSRLVYHVARESDRVSKFTALPGAFPVVVVEPNGDAFAADAI